MTKIEDLLHTLEEDDRLLQAEINRLKKRAKKAKADLMKFNWQFPLELREDRDVRRTGLEFSRFLLVTSRLVIFPDEEVLDKLKSMNVSNKALRWFTDNEKLTSEILRIRKLPAVFLLSYSWFFGCISHLETKLMNELISESGLAVVYNKKRSNAVFRHLTEFFRRRKYNSNKEQTGKMTRFDAFINRLFERLATEQTDAKKLKNSILKPIGGDTFQYYNLLNHFHTFQLSERKVYYEMFDLLKLIMSDQELLTEAQYSNNTKLNFTSYEEYRIDRVRKILRNY